MKTAPALFTVFFLLAAATVARGEGFDELDGNAFQHPESGWVFPQRVGEFERDNEPKVVGSARDGVANYKDAFQSKATVYVYSSKSDAMDTSYSGAKSVIEDGLQKEATLAQPWSEGPFRVGKSIPLVGDKVFYKIGLGATSSHSYLYYFDTGPWIVKVRLSGPLSDKEVFARIDNFVRELPWDSLRSAANDCSGTACKTDRPMAVHGYQIEIITALLVKKNAPKLFSKDMPICDAAAIASALVAEPSKPSDGKAVPISSAACTVKKGLNANFLRLNLESDILADLGGGPDGLSYRGPISLVAIGDNKAAVLTHLSDGKLDADDVSRILSTAADNQGLPFAAMRNDGKDLKPMSRPLGKIGK